MLKALCFIADSSYMKYKKTHLYATSTCLSLIVALLLLNGMTIRKNPDRRSKDTRAKGRPVYEEMFKDGRLRIAVFWGWDHPRDTILGSFPAFETLNGKRLYYKGRPVQIEIGMITQINHNPKAIFKQALEDPTIDIVIYSGHGRYGRGMAFSEMDDIFRCGNGDIVEDRHIKPYRNIKASSEDLDSTFFPQSYKIVFLNTCDSDGHFRKSWHRRFQRCNAPIDLLTVEYPVFNYYDNIRVLNFLRDILAFSDWKTIKKHYDSEVHKRKNRLIIEPVFVSDDKFASAN